MGLFFLFTIHDADSGIDCSAWFRQEAKVSEEVSQLLFKAYSKNVESMTDSVTLFCIPFAGGSAYSYRSIEQRMNRAIKVVALELPGRGRRLNEARITCLHGMARDLLSIMRPSLGQPYAIFGHSMGGLLSYLITCQLVKEQLTLPIHLIISGKEPPHRIKNEAPWHNLPMKEFKRKLAELGGCPASILADNELMEYFAPIIRDDMQAMASYTYDPFPPFNVPISVMIGSSETTTIAEAADWRDMTTSNFSVMEYEGGHFFLFDHLDSVCTRVHEVLSNL